MSSIASWKHRFRHLVPIILIAAIAGACRDSTGPSGFKNVRTFSLTLNSNAAEATIAEVGALRLFARCLINDAGFDRIQVIATSSAGNWYHAATLSSGAGLDAGAEHIVVQLSIGTGSTLVSRQIDRGAVLEPNNEWIAIQGETTTLGLNVYDNACFVAGVVATQRNTLD